jgi:hypothetical protein
MKKYTPVKINIDLPKGINKYDKILNQLMHEVMIDWTHQYIILNFDIFEN